MSTFAERLRSLVGDLVGEAFVSDIHNLDGRGSRELEQLADTFEAKILGFMMDERRKTNEQLPIEREPERKQFTTDPEMPHAYLPSAMHMGDCLVCGQLQGAPLHSPFRRDK